MSTPEIRAWLEKERKKSVRKVPVYYRAHHVQQQFRREATPRVATTEYHLARRNEAEKRDILYETVLNNNDLLNYHTSYVYACLSVLLIIKYYDKQSRAGLRGKSICSEYGEGENLAKFINKQLSVYPDKEVLSLFQESEHGTTKTYKLNYRHLFPHDRQPLNLNVSINPGIYKEEGDEDLYREPNLDIPPATWAHFVYYMKRVRFYRITGVYDKSLFMNSLEDGELYPFVIDDTVLEILSEWSYLRLYDYVQRMLVSRDREDKLQIKYPSDYGKEGKPTTSATPSSSSAAASYPSRSSAASYLASLETPSYPSSSSAASYPPPEPAASFTSSYVPPPPSSGPSQSFGNMLRKATTEESPNEEVKTCGFLGCLFGRKKKVTGGTRKQIKSKRKSTRKSHRRSTRKSKPSQ